MKCLIIVPAYNEEDNIYNVVQRIRAINPLYDIVVINDGSTDNTYEEAIRAGAKVIDLSCNLGIGGAVQTGYIYAFHNGYDAAVQIDGDGQHDPKDLSRLMDDMNKNKCNMIIGSRFVEDYGYKPGVLRHIGIKYFSKLTSILCGESYYDTTSGYRLVDKKGIRLFAQYYPVDYPEVETIVYAHKHGLKVKEKSVEMSQRQGGKSSITPIKSIYYMIKVTLASIKAAFLSDKEVRV